MAELPTSLNERQLRFCHEYIAEPIAAQAYLRVFGGAYSTARVEGPKLLANPAIAAEIESARDAWAKRCRLSFQRTLRTLAAIAFADPADLYESDDQNGGLPKPRPWNEIPPGARKNIKSVKFKRRKLSAKGDPDCLWEIEELEYKVADKEWAIGKLCEYLGITKGSLTPDELRAIIYGTTAAHQPATQEAQTVGASAVVSGGGSADDTTLDADE